MGRDEGLQERVDGEGRRQGLEGKWPAEAGGLASRSPTPRGGRRPGKARGLFTSGERARSGARSRQLSGLVGNRCRTGLRLLPAPHPQAEASVGEAPLALLIT